MTDEHSQARLVELKTTQAELEDTDVVAQAVTTFITQAADRVFEVCRGKSIFKLGRGHQNQQT